MWHQGSIATPDVGTPRAPGGEGLQHVGTLDAPVLDPRSPLARAAWQSLGTQLFERASAFHLGRGPIEAFMAIPACAPTWFQWVNELKMAHHKEGESRFADPCFEQALQRWTEEVQRRGHKGRIPDEYEPGANSQERERNWAGVINQAPLQWQARFRQWSSEHLIPAASLPPFRRARSRA